MCEDDYAAPSVVKLILTVLPAIEAIDGKVSPEETGDSELVELYLAFIARYHLLLKDSPNVQFERIYTRCKQYPGMGRIDRLGVNSRCSGAFQCGASPEWRARSFEIWIGSFETAMSISAVRFNFRAIKHHFGRIRTTEVTSKIHHENPSEIQAIRKIHIHGKLCFGIGVFNR
jgi:hypothetical protein